MRSENVGGAASANLSELIAHDANAACRLAVVAADQWLWRLGGSRRFDRRFDVDRRLLRGHRRAGLWTGFCRRRLGSGNLLRCGRPARKWRRCALHGGRLRRAPAGEPELEQVRHCRLPEFDLVEFDGPIGCLRAGGCRQQRAARQRRRRQPRRFEPFCLKGNWHRFHRLRKAAGCGFAPNSPHVSERLVRPRGIEPLFAP
jgi:hypothetical protein